MKTTRSLIGAVVALACSVAGVLGATLGLLPPMIGLGLFFVGGALGLVALIAGLVAKVRKKRRGGALAATIGAVPFLVVAISAAMMSAKTGPRINDITTDTRTPPAFTRSTEHGDYPAELAEKAAAAYPEIKPLELSTDPRAAVELAIEVARDRGWTIVDTREDGFEAYALTRLFRFRDDIVVRVSSGPDGGAVIDMRSASRDGKADFGVNAARIKSFLDEMARRRR